MLDKAESDEVKKTMNNEGEFTVPEWLAVATTKASYLYTDIKDFLSFLERSK